MELWIARDRNNTLRLYLSQPFRWKRIKSRFDRFVSRDYFMTINSDLYPEVTWENSPQKVKVELLAA